MGDAKADVSAKPEGSWASSSAHLVLLGGLMAFAPLAYGVLAWMKESDFAVEGTARASGAAGPAFTLEHGRCEVTQAKARTLRLSFDGEGSMSVDPSGAEPVVAILPPAACRLDGRPCPTISLTRASCSRFDVVVEPTSAIFNKHRVHRGHVQLECAIEGGRFEAALGFRQCV